MLGILVVRYRWKVEHREASMPPRNLSLVAPVAAAAAVFTLLCSSYLLSRTGWQKTAHVKVETGSTLAFAGKSLLDYMQGSASSWDNGDSGQDEHPPSDAIATSRDLADALPPPPAAAAPPVVVAHTEAMATFAEAEYDGYFLYARNEMVEGYEPEYLRMLLKSLLGIAVMLKRTLVLPEALCRCRDMVNLTDCEGEPAPYFDCPLRVALDGAAWKATTLVPAIKPPRFLAGPPSKLPEVVRCSHLRVLLPDGMDDSEITFALRQYSTVRWLEISSASKAFCGWDTRMPGNAERMRSFTAESNKLVAVAGKGPVSLFECTHYRGGTGEVLQFTNLGCNEKHLVSAAHERLPASIRERPKGTDIMVTFATGSVATMASNWVATVRKAGVAEVLIGALDQSMMDVCEKDSIPCILIEGGEITKQLAQRSAGNVRSDPKLYPKMSVLKVGFYNELLSFGYNVWACDADAVFVNDPRAMMREHPWDQADIAIATDCIDVPSDNRYPLLHCDFNTGLVYMRSRPEVIEFTERWRETIANAKETRIRDQAAFNMMTKLRPLEPLKSKDGKTVPRLFSCSNGGDGKIKIGVLPLSRYLNGHTFFVQHAHTLPKAEPPLSVHMTYQFAEGSSFAHGKRQRLREAGLWLVDDDAYYNGKYLALSDAAATLAVEPMGPNVDSRDAVKKHLAEQRHRISQLRPLLGIAKALGRALILPRMLCYCDFMWKEMQNCRVGGAESMRLPFDCPMDHVLDTPRWFENELGVGVREPSFLKNLAAARPAFAANVTSSTAKVSLRMTPLNDEGVIAALKPHEDARIIELSDARGTFCGFKDAATNRLFERETKVMLHYHRTPFCMMEGSNNAPLFSQCCSPRKPGDKFFPCVHGFDPPDALPACK